MAWQVVGSITLAGDFQLLGGTPRAGYGLSPTSFRGSTVALPFPAQVFIQQSFDFPATGWSPIVPIQLSGGANGRTFGELTYMPYVSPVVQGANFVVRVAGSGLSGLTCNIWAFV